MKFYKLTAEKARKHRDEHGNMSLPKSTKTKKTRQPEETKKTSKHPRLKKVKSLT